tara:strand:+ start:33 stop:227 length:195 start_codon:yes stop_codon:yes gene_type:complete
MLRELIIEVLQREHELLKEKNPVGTLRLKRKTVLEYLTNRIDMLEQQAEEVSKARELLNEQDNN